ncbi:hypothetical protein [Deminuibacter soli]|nr:hypothetical protein [Deminuibacter soli]
MSTATQRQQYLERVADGLYKKHYGKIKQAMREPTFYVDGAQSRINRPA